ncbi:MAG: hypothetical protein IKP91_06440 [Bacteroidaceae bacterium]|nr:hypothetical protein [Bacteroidaceae bacterium]
MKTKYFRRLAMFVSIVYACALNAQTNKVATPLFSADVKDVVSMYCDENAETFCLYTQTTKYTVSKEGEILSKKPSKAIWACWEDGIMYTHAEGDRFILNQYGDTIVSAKHLRDKRDSGLFAGGKPMFCKDGVFYWWFGPISSVSSLSGIYSMKDGDESLKLRGLYSLHCTGLVAMDNMVVCTANNIEKVGYYTLFFNDESTEWVYQEPKEIPGLKAPVGLSLVGDTFYIWSNDTQTMYTIPKSYFGGVTGVQTPLMEAEMESSGFFTLDGRPADGTQKGIFIRNGKKVLVK